MSVRTEKKDGITTIVLDRPNVKNAVDRATAEALADAFRAFDADPDARVAVLFGEGGTFCAGADLKAIATGAPNRIAEDGDGPMGPSRMLSRNRSSPRLPVTPSPAVWLALFCDMRVVEEDAVLGVFCGAGAFSLIDGGTVRLPRLIGLARALDLILTGRAVSAAEALSIGLASRVVPKGTAREAAESLAARSPPSRRYACAAIAYPLTSSTISPSTRRSKTSFVTE